MTTIRVIGVDPGPVPGIVRLMPCSPPEVWRLPAIDVVQCSADVAPQLFTALAFGDWPLSRGSLRLVVQIERFVIGRRSARSTTPAASRITRELIEDLRRLTESWTGNRTGPHLHSAAEVKPWATDERLDRAGLLAATKGMPHARDAARHALFAACRYGGIPDPLSKQNKQNKRS